MEAIRINDYNNQKVHDFDVIKKVLSGEKGLYEILMRRNNQKLYRVIRSYITDEDVIKDIMQDTYIKAYEKLYQFKMKSEFSTWLMRIGINETLRELKVKKNNIISLPNIEIKEPSTMNPEHAIIQKEAKWILEKTIDSLPEKYKVIYILREVENMEIKEISDCLNLTTSNVKVRIYRSKQLLKEKLFELSHKQNIFEFGLGKCDALVNNIMKII